MVGLYLVFGLVIGFFFGTIAGGLPRNDGDITYQNKTEICVAIVRTASIWWSYLKEMKDMGKEKLCRLFRV